MTTQRKEYDQAFKLEIARMVVDQDIAIAQIVKNMRVGRTAVCRWVAQYKAELLGQAGIGKPLTAEQQKIRQLEQENR